MQKETSTDLFGLCDYHLNFPLLTVQRFFGSLRALELTERNME